MAVQCPQLWSIMVLFFNIPCIHQPSTTSAPEVSVCWRSCSWWTRALSWRRTSAMPGWRLPGWSCTCWKRCVWNTSNYQFFTFLHQFFPTVHSHVYPMTWKGRPMTWKGRITRDGLPIKHRHSCSVSTWTSHGRVLVVFESPDQDNGFWTRRQAQQQQQWAGHSQLSTTTDHG